MSADEAGDVVRICAEEIAMSRIMNLVVFMFIFGACAGADAVDAVDAVEHGEDIAADSSTSASLLAGSHHVSIPAAGATAKPNEAWFDRFRWQIPTAGGVYFPIVVETGCTITGWAVRATRISWQQPVAATLIEVNPSTSDSVAISFDEAKPDELGAIRLEDQATSYIVDDSHNVYLELWSDSIWGTSFVYGADVWYTCPI